MIETLFGIFIVALSATIAAASIPMATTLRVKGGTVNKATSLANKQIESIRLLGYANTTAEKLFAAGLIDNISPISTDTYSFTNVDSSVRDNPARVLASGTGQVTIQQVSLELKRITVQVGYRERGQTKTVRVGTLIANL